MIHLKRLLYRLKNAFKRKSSRTVTYSFSLMLVAVGALVAAVLTGSGDSYIRISTNTSQITPGKSFKLNVYAGASVPVNAVNIKVRYPKDKVTVKNISTGESVITIWAKDPYVEGDTVILQGGTFRKGFIGEHLIASIDMVAKESGDAVFSVSELALLAGDGTGREVPVEAASKESLRVSVAAKEGGILDAALEVRIATDLNGDGLVTMADILNFMEGWGGQSLVYDFNADNKVNFTDFAIILAQSFKY